ncbi:dihydrofolate reductase [Alicyclobacillus contaminans]|uniref:dihydrofolate reductase n=1 Tax=Alicyclobacillus contaminans TaxID=392016 RepID=UPI0004024CD4|nr:dihydrofolate reductase [Alicyclobacillus contaminans]GMA50085.1 dihydrofolate reductase [Alicyclobacillus contaminans]
MISFIVAMAENRVIGANGGIPWRIPGELAYFKRVTMGHAVVMGRATYDSIGKPLPGRQNYILTRDESLVVPGAHVIHSVEPALHLARTEEVFVIGGERVFRAFLPYVSRVYQTVVHREFAGDTYFPELPGAWRKVSSTPGPDTVIPHTFEVLERMADH